MRRIVFRLIASRCNSIRHSEASDIDLSYDNLQDFEFREISFIGSAVRIRSGGAEVAGDAGKL